MEKFLLQNFRIIRILISIIIGLLLAASLIFIFSKDALFSIKLLLFGPLLSKARFGNVIETATPILLCGLAIAIPFRAGQFYIGAEGSLYLGAALGTAFAVSTRMPSIFHIPLTLIVAGISGGLWSFFPAFLKAKWRVNELVSSLMLNYIAYFLGLYLINFHFRDKSAGYLVSYQLPESAWFQQFIPHTRIHWGIILALIITFLIYYFLFFTTKGYEIRMTGLNRDFAQYSGININKVIILSISLAGLLSGIAGISEVMGIHRRFNWQMSPGYGWDGVIVAIIGRNHPLAIILSSLFIAYLRVSGQVLNIQSDIPYELITTMQALIILLITAEAFLEGIRFKLILKEAGIRK